MLSYTWIPSFIKVCSSHVLATNTLFINQPWVFTGRTNAEAATLWLPDVKNSLEEPWRWERVRAWAAGVTQNWEGWTAALPQWTRVWANSGRQPRTGEPGALQSMEPQSWTQLGDWAATLFHQYHQTLRHAGMTSSPDKTTGNWRKGWTGWTLLYYQAAKKCQYGI